MSQSFRHFITKIPEIAAGWKNLVLPNSRTEEMALKRLEICMPCEHNSSTPTLSLTSTCKACGCVLEAKSRSPKSICPLNKWPNSDQI